MTRSRLVDRHEITMEARVRNRLSFLPFALLLLTLACHGGTSPEPDSSTAGTDRSDPPRIDSAEVERLRALGYVNVAPALPPGAKVGVLAYDRDRSGAGLNLFTNAQFCSAQLIDMQGKVLHSWSHGPCFRWGNAALSRSGDLLVAGRLPHEANPQAAIDARYLLRLDWDGNVLWKKPLPVHHDVEETPAGRILTLTYAFRVIPEVDPAIPVRDNSIALLDRDGDLLEEVSLWELLRSAPDVLTLQEGKVRTFEGGQEIDLFHANSVEWMRHPDLDGAHPIFGPDTVLICVRNQDTLAIFDWKSRRLLWAWGQGELSGPHDATLLPTGNILVFDNGLGRDWSRVVEVDPLRNKIVWQYRAPDAASFYSLARGANQRLANGNTLITESDDGRAFEVTPEGEIVWEFLNPNMTDEREPSVIVRMRRFEGLAYADLAASVGAGRGLPFVVD